MTPKQSDVQQRVKAVSGERPRVREAKIRIQELRNLRLLEARGREARDREASSGDQRGYGFGRWRSFVSGGQTREASSRDTDLEAGDAFATL